MRFTIVFTERADDHLSGLRARDQVRIVDEIEEQLTFQPLTPTSRRRELKGAAPSFEHVSPVWQLRVDAFRIIYDVDLDGTKVTIRAVLYKGNKTTKEIL
jgi:mRNA-degrading endonuclease RelE of RelBE toxin-antitoxin system